MVRSLRRHDACTLSETYRAVARTHTIPGRVATVAGWAVLSVWLLPHLLRRAATAADRIVTAIEEATP